MIHHLIPLWLDKPILSAVLTAYADKLKMQTAPSTTPNLNLQKFAKPPHLQKTPQVDLTFDPAKFPSITPAPKPTTSTTTAAANAPPSKPPENIPIKLFLIIYNNARNGLGWLIVLCLC